MSLLEAGLTRVFATLIPGLGHVFLGRWGDGLGWFVAYQASVALFLFGLFSSFDVHWVLAIIGGVGMLLIWALSLDHVSRLIRQFDAAYDGEEGLDGGQE